MKTSLPQCVALRNRLARFAATCACVGAALQAQAVLQAFPLASMDGFYAIGDVDADGVRDVAIRRYATGVVDVFSLRTGALHMQMAAAQPFLWRILPKTAGDVDGDGHDDVLYFTADMNNYYVQVASGWTGSILFTSPGRPGGWGYSGLGDVNGDGKSEMLLGDPEATVGSAWAAGRVDLIDGASGQVLRSHLGTYSGQNLAAPFSVGDLDTDRIEDYVVRAWGGELWGYSGRTGQQLFYFAPSTYSFGEYVKKVGDFNADGYGDFAVYDRGSYPFVTYEQVFVFGGPSATQLWNRITWIQNPGPLVFGRPTGWIGDLDGDGHDDLASLGGAVVSGRSGNFLVETMWGGLIESPGDVNLDGVPDLLSYGYAQPGVVELRLLSGLPPGTASIGTPCPDPTGIDPVIGIGTGARLGRTMTVNLSKANQNLLLAVLGMGFSDQQWNSVPLPIDLTPYGMPGCQWYIAADAALWMPTVGLNGTRHHAQHPIPVPQANSLLGTQIFFQWLVLDQNPVGALGSVTRAMRATIVP